MADVLDRRGAEIDGILGVPPLEEIKFTSGPIPEARGAREKAGRALEQWGRDVEHAKNQNLAHEGYVAALTAAGQKFRKEALPALQAARDTVQRARRQLEERHFLTRAFIETTNHLTRAALLAQELGGMRSTRAQGLVRSGDPDGLMAALMLPSWRVNDLFGNEDARDTIVREGQMARLERYKPQVFDELTTLKLWETHLADAADGVLRHLGRHGILEREE